MSQLDDLGRRHGERARAACDDAVPPPIATFVSSPPTSTAPLRLILVAAAVVMVLLVAVVGVTARSGTGEVAVGSTTTLTAEASTSSSTVPTTVPQTPGLLEFDIRAFLDSKLNGAFGDSGWMVGVVALVPSSDFTSFDSWVNNTDLSGIEGVTHVPAHDIRRLADAYADQQGTSRLEGSWVAVGLIPSFLDSPTGSWVGRLDGYAGAIVRAVPYEPSRTRLPDDWGVVAEMDFGIPDYVLTVGIDPGVVIVDDEATYLVRPDGAWVQGGAPPDGVPGQCCGEFEIFGAGDTVLLTKTLGGRTWAARAPEFTWTEVDRSPLTRNSLGWVTLEDRIVIVERAGRSIVGESRVVTFDTESWGWRVHESLPTGLDVGEVTTDGEVVLAAGVAQDSNNNILSASRFPRLFASATLDAWEELPEVPIDGQATSIGWAEGAGLVAWNYDLDAALLDLNGAWVDLSDVPIDFSECYPRTGSADGGAVGFCSQPVWFDAESRQWTPISWLTTGNYVVRGEQILAVVGINSGTTWLVSTALPPSGS